MCFHHVAAFEVGRALADAVGTRHRALLEVFGPLGAVQADSPGAILRGRVESMYRNTLILTFGGGTNEVQRDIIAMAALGMPHYKN